MKIDELVAGVTHIVPCHSRGKGASCLEIVENLLPDRAAFLLRRLEGSNLHLGHVTSEGDVATRSDFGSSLVASLDGVLVRR
jgi:hypothetical protein